MPGRKFDRRLIPEHPDLTFERALWDQGLRIIAGVDEAGRGALAGPVSAGAVVLPVDVSDLPDRLNGVRDSKAMQPERRECWAEVIKTVALAWGVGFASAAEIDQIGIVPATCLAAARALNEISGDVEHLLVDYLTLPNIKIAQTALIKGDARSLTIAAASILAKTARDALLVEMDAEFPGYYFASNKGYATQAHREAIADLGPCGQHRVSFAPINAYYGLFKPETGSSLG